MRKKNVNKLALGNVGEHSKGGIKKTENGSKVMPDIPSAICEDIGECHKPESVYEEINRHSIANWE